MSLRFWVAFLAVLLLATPAAPAAVSGFDLAEKTAKLAEEYSVQMGLAGGGAAMGVALTKAGETWNLAGLAAADRLGDPKARQYLESVRDGFKNPAGAKPTASDLQLAGMDCLYKSLDTLAILIARHNGDQAALDMIRSTEQKVYGVAGRSDPRGPIMAAMAGGVMTMLALIAGQADRDGRWNEPLRNELQKRREVDANITRMSEAGSDERLLLMLNNYLQGAVSMAQIVALAADENVKPKLLRIEIELGRSREFTTEDQIVGAAKALAETSFLAAPTVVAPLKAGGQ